MQSTKFLGSVEKDFYLRSTNTEYNEFLLLCKMENVFFESSWKEYPKQNNSRHSLRQYSATLAAESVNNITNINTTIDENPHQLQTITSKDQFTSRREITRTVFADSYTNQVNEERNSVMLSTSQLSNKSYLNKAKSSKVNESSKIQLSRSQ